MSDTPETVNSVELAQRLIQCPSVTPIEGGAIALLQETLENMGFTCHRLHFEEPGEDPVDNIYARLGDSAPNFCFAGHTDVVPVGDEASWSFDPFSGEVKDGWLCGRGASDMKGAVAAFVAAASRYMAENGAPDGSISLLITGDEEGPGVNGTRKMLDWLDERGEKLDFCLVGEPTNPKKLGEMIKIGRRGTMTGTIHVRGVQGHTAYPHLADNPLPRLVKLLDALIEMPLDDGSDNFQPTNLEITTIDVGNPASNVIPETGSATFNCRFNDLHSGETLEKRIRETLDATGFEYELKLTVGGESFLTPPGPLSSLVSDAVAAVLDMEPELSTTGGTSDARFIKDHCPVVEFGIVGETMHRVDERVRVEDVEKLTDIYTEVLERFFRAAP